MTLTFDWFLPTSGDGRTIYGRGHSLRPGARHAHSATGHRTSIRTYYRSPAATISPPPERPAYVVVRPRGSCTSTRS